MSSGGFVVLYFIHVCNHLQDVLGHFLQMCVRAHNYVCVCVCQPVFYHQLAQILLHLHGPATCVGGIILDVTASTLQSTSERHTYCNLHCNLYNLRIAQECNNGY